MPSDDELSSRLASAADAVQDAPVDIAEVTSAARRHLRVVRLALAATGVLASLAVAAVALAARDARDPSFNVPLVEDKADDKPTPTPTPTASPGVVRVPDVRRLPVDDARATITAERLRPALEGECVGDTPCVVVSQDPGPGTEVAADSRVVLTRGAPTDPVIVPTVTGLGREEAVQAIADARLDAVIEGACAPTAPACTVASQQPLGGVMVEAGAKVTIVLVGGAFTSVPNVVKRPELLARLRLKRARLVATSVKPCPPSRRCVVTRQAPEPGKKVPTDSAVTLTLVPTMSVVPGVIGRSEEQAAAAIAAAQLEPVSSGCPEEPCTVVAQAPQGGRLAAIGSSVRITLEPRE